MAEYPKNLEEFEAMFPTDAACRDYHGQTGFVARAVGVRELIRLDMYFTSARNVGTRCR